MAWLYNPYSARADALGWTDTADISNSVDIAQSFRNDLAMALAARAGMEPAPVGAATFDRAVAGFNPYAGPLVGGAGGVYDAGPAGYAAVPGMDYSGGLGSSSYPGGEGPLAAVAAEFGRTSAQQTAAADEVAREAAALGLSPQAYRQYMEMASRLGLPIRDFVALVARASALGVGVRELMQLAAVAQSAGVDLPTFLDMWGRARAAGLDMNTFMQLAAKARQLGLDIGQVIDMAAKAKAFGVDIGTFMELMSQAKSMGMDLPTMMEQAGRARAMGVDPRTMLEMAARGQAMGIDPAILMDAKRRAAAGGTDLRTALEAAQGGRPAEAVAAPEARPEPRRRGAPV
jgi:hypothetical protein